ncbi:unnamed protein product [Caenorhabditis auriculariae]|uniref:B30.2/SPRY domain-containing protein n=1 Tax=Caenorhabditis auriculariae TaxID=2777116 RepID=A0A8S1HNM4_9PELO|nr:unnamed protein product [Caenorhabditis auriculariae]
MAEYMQKSPKKLNLRKFSRQLYVIVTADENWELLNCSAVIVFKWFHGRCLKDLKEFNGVAFMVCYTFHCKDCSQTGEESWQAKQANFSHMCITVLANLAAEYLSASGLLSPATLPQEPIYFNIFQKIIPYMNENWLLLTSMPKRVKNTWHTTLQKTLAKEKDLFLQKPDDPDSFALAETNLADVGPLNEIVKQIGRKSNFDKSNAVALAATFDKLTDESGAGSVDGPKTRGASKRRNAEAAPSGKKPKMSSDQGASAAGTSIDPPLNKDGYRYFLAERDPNVFEPSRDESAAFVIPAFSYRVVPLPTVGLSQNDKAYQLQVEALAGSGGYQVTGHEGYAMVRATHSVCKGTWYYEVSFKEQPEGSHIRIGWSQPYAVLQACAGYNKFSYSWRSKHGTKFHDAKGKKYHFGGFKEGDVLGCLIHLPIDCESNIPTISSKDYLPESYKDSTLINYRHNLFFEVHDEVADKLKSLKELPRSRIEFFHNSKSCGVAYENIHAGYYHPAISIYHKAKVSVNFGPRFLHLPPGAKGMFLRAEEQQHEQTLSDMLYLVENDHVHPQ